MADPHETSNVVVLGASNRPDRYAFRAQQQLTAAGYRVIPVTPQYSEVQGLATVARLAQIHEPVDTVTIYLRPDRMDGILDELLALKPRRVIFNPGAEHAPAEQRLTEAGVIVRQECTLVLLSTGQFDDLSRKETSDTAQ